MGASKTDMLKTSRLYGQINYSCPVCVKGLIKNRSKLDSPYAVKTYADECLSVEEYIYTSTPIDACDQTIMDVYMTLESLVDRVKINSRQRNMIEMFFKGYDNKYIAENSGVGTNVDRELNKVVDKINLLNEGDWMDMLHYTGMVKVAERYKRCIKCEEYKTESSYVFNKTNNRLEAQCKSCRNK